MKFIKRDPDYYEFKISKRFQVQRPSFAWASDFVRRCGLRPAKSEGKAIRKSYNHPCSNGLICTFINEDHTAGDVVFFVSIVEYRF